MAIFSSCILLSLCVAFQPGTQVSSPPKTTVVLVQVENAFLKTVKSTSVSARVPGILEAMDVGEGTRVTRGQELGRLSDSTIRLQMDRAKVALEKVRLQTENSIDLRLAEKRSAVADNELERAISANSKITNTYPAREVDRLQLVADGALLEIERAQYQQELHVRELKLAEIELAQAQDMLDKHQIVSPVTGIVVVLDKSRGEWTEPGMSLLQIVRTDLLRVEGFVSSGHAGMGLEGKSATVSIDVAGEQHKVSGVVTFVSPETNPVNGQVRVFLEIENPDHLFRSGVRVEAVIDLQE